MSIVFVVQTSKRISKLWIEKCFTFALIMDFEKKKAKKIIIQILSCKNFWHFHWLDISQNSNFKKKKRRNQSNILFQLLCRKAILQVLYLLLWFHTNDQLNSMTLLTQFPFLKKWREKTLEKKVSRVEIKII